MEVLPYCSEDATAWDNLVRAAKTGTFLQTRQFLSYHGDRFRDCSLVVKDESLRAVLPAAQDLGQPTRVVSHPGLTFGGLIYRQPPGLETLERVWKMVLGRYRRAGFEALIYKPVPFIYQQTPWMDDLWVLQGLGARLVGCQLSATIDLAHRAALSGSKKKSLKKAARMNLTLQVGATLENFWPVLVENLAARYQTQPVHSLAEISQLQSWFPDQIECVVAYQGTEVLAGVVLFIYPQAVHVQYAAATELGFVCCAQDFVYDHCIHWAQERGFRYFDFGTNNQQWGRVLNDTLYQSKHGHGAGSTTHEFWQVELGGFA